MAVRRAPQAILIVSLIAFSWPMMMLVHEAGHVAGALATGGHVQRVIWHPLVFSRTDVAPNPSPRIEPDHQSNGDVQNQVIVVQMGVC